MLGKMLNLGGTLNILVTKIFALALLFSQIDSDKSSTTYAFIYCQNSGNHVYYGTYSTCVTGNGYTAEQMNNNEKLTIFNRYN